MSNVVFESFKGKLFLNHLTFLALLKLASNSNLVFSHTVLFVEIKFEMGFGDTDTITLLENAVVHPL